jgi:hypothetical protein
MADTDSNKPLVYDLISRLNLAFGRVFRSLTALEKTAVFPPATIERLKVLSNELRADSNHHLLEIMLEIEQRDWAAYGQLRNGEPPQVN